MIDFTDYTPTKEPTYTPFPTYLEARLLWCLNNNNIKNYRILTKEDCDLKNKPETVPNFYSDQQTNIQTSNYEYLISYIPSEYIIQKLALIDGLAKITDPDMIEWQRKREEKAKRIHLMQYDESKGEGGW